MARAGEEIYNPVLHDRIVYRKSARDTGGDLFRADLFVSPRGGNRPHVHPFREEYFEAIASTRASRWEIPIVPPGYRHGYGNRIA